MAIPLSYNFRNLLVRRLSTLSASLGIGLVVAVFILVLALALGFAHALRTAGLSENAIILRKGSNAEISSFMLQEQVDSIAVRHEIEKDERGQPLVVQELVTLVVMPRKADGAPAQVVIRGTSEMALGIRSQVRIADGGRMFRPGLPEIVVGRALSKRIRNLALGETVNFRRQDWKVVGIFETGGSGFESEIWCDVTLMQAAFQREGTYNSLTLRMAEPSRFKELKDIIESDPKYENEIKTEAEYYADQSETLSRFIGILGTLITIIMSAGAIFGAMNTMYAAVGTRSREIATLRALGFSRGSILVSFLLESIIISILGGILGCLASLPINGITTSTINWDTFSELAFAFRITPKVLCAGMAFAIIMGAAGGLLPALRAARLSITQGLRQI